MPREIQRHGEGRDRSGSERTAYDPIPAAEAVRERPCLAVVAASHITQPPDQSARTPAAEHMSADQHQGEYGRRDRDARRPLETEHDADADRTVGADARIL